MPGLFDPEFDPSVIEGSGLPVEQPAPVTRGGDTLRETLPLLLALAPALAKGGRVGGAALLRGYERARTQRDETTRRDRLDAENSAFRREQLQSLIGSRRDAATNARTTREQADEQKRQTFFQQFGQAMDGLTSDEDVALQLPLWQARARSLGLEDPLALAPTPAVLSRRKAAKELEELKKARPNDWWKWSKSVDGKDYTAGQLEGWSAPPEAAPKVTYGAPDFYRVGKSVVQLRAGSDGKMYNDQGQVVAGAQPYQPPSTAQPDMVTLLGPDGKTQRFVPKSQANGFLANGWTVFDAVTGRQIASDARDKAEGATSRSTARQTIAALAEDLAADPNLTDISGSLFNGTWREWVPGNAEALRKYNELLAKLVLERRGDFKGQGAVSNYEQQTVERAVGLTRNVPTGSLQAKLKAIAQEYRGGGAGQVTVQTPDGQTFTFPDQAAADAFKRDAGIK